MRMWAGWDSEKMHILFIRVAIDVSLKYRIQKEERVTFSGGLEIISLRRQGLG